MNIIHTSNKTTPEQLTYINKIEQFPGLLRHIPDPPDSLSYMGALPSNSNTLYICIVGSRKASEYGKNVVTHLLKELYLFNKFLPMCIVSGLAYGIDAFAHEQALKLGFTCMAVPGSGLNDAVLYPQEHLNLAHKITQSGGILLSEYDPQFVAQSWSFPKRNRIMAGIAHITLIIEGSINSGSLITAKLALDYNRIVCTVPGSIFDKGSEASQWLLHEGAYPISHAYNIIELLSQSYPDFYKKALQSMEYINKNKVPIKLTAIESEIIKHLAQTKTMYQIIEHIIHMYNATNTEVLHTISQLEINGFIEQKNGLYSTKIN